MDLRQHRGVDDAGNGDPHERREADHPPHRSVAVQPNGQLDGHDPAHQVAQHSEEAEYPDDAAG
jgi:hypothetical protein